MGLIRILSHFCVYYILYYNFIEFVLKHLLVSLVYILIQFSFIWITATSNKL